MSHIYISILIHALFSTKDRRQGHHREVSFQEEVIAFLEKQGIVYDPRYVFA